MKILHRVAFDVTSESRLGLSSIGIEIDVPDGKLKVLIVDESDKKWPLIKEFAKKDCNTHFVITEFTENEILQASACEIHSDWHHGYPEPSGDSSYLNETFDLKNYCEKCGCGLKQKAPFLLKGEPKWGRKSIFSLHWQYDELFVKPETWNLLFKPFGIDSLPALHYKKRSKLSSVVQLLLPEPSIVVDVNGLDACICESCGRSKTALPSRGYYPRIIEGDLNAIAKTKNYFGHGAAAFNEIIIGAELVQKLHASGIKGMKLTPLSSTPLSPPPTRKGNSE